MNIKKVKLIDSGKYIDIIIDFDKMIVIREQDFRTAKIQKIEKNVLYIASPSAQEQNVIVFDDKFAVFGGIDKRVCYYNQPMNVWIGHKDKVIYYEVAKNACTSIASSIYTHNWKTLFSPKITDKYSVWDCLAWKNHKIKIKYLFINPVYKKHIHQYKDYTKFLVYDDPVDRFIRAINNKHINHHSIASIIFPPYSKNIHDFIDQCILTAQLNCLNSKTWDQHLVPISQSGVMYLDDIDNFVYLKDVSIYLKEKFGWTLGRHNAMPKEKKPIHRDMLQPYQLERIKEIYKEDYLIPIKYKDKFYSIN